MYLFATGHKHGDFVVFNPMKIELTSAPLELREVVIAESKFWKELKSMAWSANCRFFLTINRDGIVIGNVYDNNAFASNLTDKVLDHFLKGISNGKQ